MRPYGVTIPRDNLSRAHVYAVRLHGDLRSDWATAQHHSAQLAAEKFVFILVNSVPAFSEMVIQGHLPICFQVEVVESGDNGPRDGLAGAMDALGTRIRHFKIVYQATATTTEEQL